MIEARNEDRRVLVIGGGAAGNAVTPCCAAPVSRCT